MLSSCGIAMLNNMEAILYLMSANITIIVILNTLSHCNNDILSYIK